MSTTLTLPRNDASTYTTALGNDVNFERLADGTAMVRGLKVFRTGKFRDSMNRPHEWKADDLAKLVANFSTLRESGVFPHVPVRRNHGRNVGDVVGYFESLSISDKWLLADLHITEPDAADKIERKTFRSRSLEVGPYVDNDERSYVPTVLGLAFVDIGAVEGLFEASDASVPSYFIITENPMPELIFFQQSQVDWAVAAAYAQGLQDAPKPVSDLAPFEFSYNGTKSADPKAVQAYIATLETAQSEARDASRKSYVAALVTVGKLPATQVEAAQAFALTMTDAQFESYKAINDAAPKLSQFENHGGGGGDGGDGNNGVTAEQQALQDAIDTVAMHRRAGMNAEDLAKTPSFQKMVALQNANK